MIDISVKVPEDRVAEFYSMYGRWLAEPEAPSDASDAEAEEWASSDVDLAKTVWAKFSPTAKALFSTLMATPNRRLRGDELAEMLGLENGKHGIAGVLAWPRRHCFSAGRKWCWEWDYPEGETAVYWMNPEMAAVFRQATES